MALNATADKVHQKYRWFLYLLVVVLVFEGMFRKLLPSALGLPVFFLKDFICIAVLYHINKLRLSGLLKQLLGRWQNLLLAISPSLLYTASLDFPLGLFAAKQYLLYVVVGLLVPIAFPDHSLEQYRRFAFYIALLVVPTTFVAVLQNSLPATHWLNLGVGGESLQGFSAGGYLRVSSTFSFTGQYSWFLNAICPFIMLELFYPYVASPSKRWPIAALLSSAFLVGIFITGGRTAVFGSVGSIVAGFILANIKAPAATLSKGIVIGAVLLSSLFILRAVKPEFFAAYDTRSKGYKKGFTDNSELSGTEEMQNRIIDSFTGWTSWFWVQEPVPVLLGNGLGVMSNGADKVSIYAGVIRSTGFWTEGDTATVAWEGGLYLLVIWYGFRLLMIGTCLKLWRSIRQSKYGIPASFLLANVLINGVMGNIGMHPPIAIWWWLSIGCLIAMHGFDKRDRNKTESRQPEAAEVGLAV